MNQMNVAIGAFGFYTPEHRVGNGNLEDYVDTSDEWIYSRTGIRNRRIALGEDENTAGLCTKACLAVLQNAGMVAEEIDVIVVATMTPDYLTPSVACMVQKNVGAVNAFAFDVNAACSGFVFALHTAESLLRSGRYKNAIVLGGDVLSKIIDWKDRATCVLFGDGAGGVLLKAGRDCRESFLGCDIHSDGSRSHSLTAFHSPVTNPFMTAPGKIENAHVQMDGRQIFDFAVKTVPANITGLLAQTGVPLSDIRYIVPHQANYKIAKAIAKKLGVDFSKLYMNIEEYGNTIAGSIPIALGEMAEKGLLQPGAGDKILITGFGGGLTWGSMLLAI